LQKPEDKPDNESDSDKSYEKAKTGIISSILATKYIIGFYKALRVIIYTVCILVALIAVIRKCNVWSILILFTVMITSYRGCAYHNLKWFNMMIIIFIVLQYLLALMNLSHLNSPSVFPEPFNDISKKPPILIPIYQHLGKIFTEKFVIDETYVEGPTKM
jgi:hypothetical protein